MITVHYYGQLRELAAKDSETLETDSAAKLYQMLKEKYCFPLCRSHVRLAINDEFADWNQQLNDGDLVVFIPPVAGG